VPPDLKTPCARSKSIQCPIQIGSLAKRYTSPYATTGICSLHQCSSRFPAMAAPAPHLRLWRLDCGAIQVNDWNKFSDTFAYTGQSRRLVVSCYLIAHGETYMLWATGLPEADLGLPLEGPGATGDSLSRTIRDQLAEINVSPESVSTLGISHYDYHHTGQAASFPSARLYMGHGDIEALRTPGNDDASANSR
jgi:hypothetical protein